MKYKSIRHLLRGNGVTDRTVQRIAVSTLGKPVALSTVSNWAKGCNPWPLPVVSQLYAHLVIVVEMRLEYAELIRLTNMSKVEILLAEKRS